jgi:hypothetical protein
MLLLDHGFAGLDGRAEHIFSGFNFAFQPVVFGTQGLGLVGVVDLLRGRHDGHQSGRSRDQVSDGREKALKNKAVLQLFLSSCHSLLQRGSRFNHQSLLSSDVISIAAWVCHL